MIKAKEFVRNAKKIVAVGRNYKAHAAEMGHAIPDQPFFFMKPTSSFIVKGQSIIMPPGATNLDYEVELGVIIGSKTKDVSIEEAKSSIAGYCLALDMTDRKTHSVLKSKGLPWLMAKGFDTSCPVSDFIPVESIKDHQALNLWLKVNGALRQRESTSEMIFPILDLISTVSRRITLEVGDVLLTGTPAGVGEVSIGDTITAGIDGVIEMTFNVASE